ncbi:MAG: V-type ATP synthase subunit F [Candidatus Micrarchaeia archaeon]
MESEKIVVVGDAPTVMGFRLAGVSEAHVASGKEAERKLEELLARPDVGIVIINENLLADMDWKLRKRIETLAKPTVITVPNYKGEVVEAASLKALVRRALGFELIK